MSNMKTGDIKMKIHNIACKESFNDVFTENSRHLAGIKKIKQTVLIGNSIKEERKEKDQM